MNFFNQNIQSENQQIHLLMLQEKEVELWIKREDNIHSLVSGNKFRKLKYNVLEAIKQQKNTLVTFGGAYSNHIIATAVAGNIVGLHTIGIIRGDELVDNLDEVLAQNKTLQIAHENNMQFDFVSREQYRHKTDANFIKQLRQKYGDFYLVPEGGTNPLAIKGCEEILTEEDKNFNYICSAVGTGGTIAGLINSASKHQNIIGFPALKGSFLSEEIKKLTPKQNNWCLQTEFHFGGYAKYNSELIRFINRFYQQTSVLLDPIYTGKMLFGIINLIKTDFFPKKTKVLAIHTGGLQAVNGINQKLKKKNLETINTECE